MRFFVPGCLIAWVPVPALEAFSVKNIFTNTNQVQLQREQDAFSSSAAQSAMPPHPFTHNLVPAGLLTVVHQLANV
jgi:hypothetical protein